MLRARTAVPPSTSTTVLVIPESAVSSTVLTQPDQVGNHGDDEYHHVRVFHDRLEGNPVHRPRRRELQLLSELYGGCCGNHAEICFSEPNDGTNFTTVTGALVTDTTGGWQYVPPIATVLHAAVGCTTGATVYGIVIPITGTADDQGRRPGNSASRRCHQPGRSDRERLRGCNQWRPAH